MDYGFGVPTRGPLSAPQMLAALVAGGEEMGFSYIGVSNHIVVARRIHRLGIRLNYSTMALLRR